MNFSATKLLKIALFQKNKSIFAIFSKKQQKQIDLFRWNESYFENCKKWIHLNQNQFVESLKWVAVKINFHFLKQAKTIAFFIIIILPFKKITTAYKKYGIN